MKNLLLSFALLFSWQVSAQIQGQITDTKGEPLPFASVYVQASSRGTTSNEAGQYELDLKKGNYKIVFQYLGYQQQVVEVDYDGRSKKLDIQLGEEAIALNEIVVKANAEDPAYAIIRKAIKKRNYYKSLVNSSSCNVYIKGVQKILDAPEKILGQEIGDLGGSLDSNRQGIVYLSESFARYHKKNPDLVKEEMKSSKVSGSDNGFSFNRASLMDFSLYENHVEIERQILSPIADNALSYYRYRLEGTISDEEGRLINKIRLIPKRREDPVFSGLIYIVNDLWNIQSTELVLVGASIKQPVLDSLIIKQVHVPLAEPDSWMLLTQTLDFKFKFMGFAGHGTFTGVFSDYELNPNHPDDFFSNEIFKVEDEANERNLVYWDSLRPIPLMEVEAKDYVKKDSLQKIWKSKPYLDSVDAKNNKFQPMNLLFGYSHSNRYEKRYWSIGSPLAALQFNTVQGYYGNMKISYRREFDDYNIKWFAIEPVLQYGLADKELRGSMKLTYNFNRTQFTRLSLSGGRETDQINDRNPITPTLNTYTTLFFRRNYLKLYEKRFGSVFLRHEVANGFMLYSEVEYSVRKRLINETDFSLSKKKERAYTPNDPGIVDYDVLRMMRDHKALIGNFTLRLRPGQKYMSYPNRKFILDSDYPTFFIRYRTAIGINDDHLSYNLLRLQMQDDFTLGIFGRTELNVMGGTFLTKKRVEITDFNHFNGNQIVIANPDDYNRGFFRLPYYEYSTLESFAEAHMQHHFEGFIIDKLPLLRKLNLKTVLSANFLYVNSDRLDPYWEVAYGVDNIGFKAFRLFRVDVASSFKGTKYDGTSIIVGIKI